MTIEDSDPQLTAYVLGELSPDELAELSAALDADPRARARLQSLFETSARLEQALGGHELALSEARRERLRAAFSERGAGSQGKPKANGAQPANDQPDNDQPADNQPADNQAIDPRDTIPAPAPRARLVPARKARRRLVGILLAALVPSIGAALLVFGQSPPEHEPSAAPMRGQVAALVPALEAPVTHALVPADLRHAVADRGGPIVADDGYAPTPQRFVLPQGLGGGEELDRSRGSRWDLLGGLASLADRGEQRESYDAISDNPFVRVTTDPRSTFSIDVDTASYALVRRFLQAGQLPPRGAVRIEELVNYFAYAYPEPKADDPVSIVADVGDAPWAPSHRLVRVALKARHVAQRERPAANLVFLIDVSGSMSTPDKLPLVKYGLRQLIGTLEARDRVAIVVYAGASGVVLRPTPGDRRGELEAALDRLEAGGSTNGGEGIELAYSLAAEHFERGGVNRVLLATDGDFNVGVTNQSDLVDLISRQAKTGVFLSVLGFGRGNYQDSTLEKLAANGNGNYAYIDDQREAEKVLVEQASGTLLTLAKDVKLQLEFNPAQVEAFRLIGYENRVLAHRDFNDDAKDAGDIGADHRVTALYEVVPAGLPVAGADVDALKYQLPASSAELAKGAEAATTPATSELLTVKLRYQPPQGGPSRLLEVAVSGPTRRLEGDFAFAAAVAELGMLLRESPHRGNASFERVLSAAQASLGDGPDRQSRAQFVELVAAARRIPRAPGRP